ncbi:MAG: hypothetical protein ACRDYV_17900 [Acidimicrobiia bacterium]
MGTILIAVCGNCSARFGGLTLGAGMLTITDHCAAPARCESCRTVVSVDIVDSDPRCPRCFGPVHSYAEESPADGPFPRRLLHWRHPRHADRFVTLPDGGAPCPKCGQHTLAFQTVGHFD